MNKNGFTLIELLVTIIIGGLIMLTMGSVSEIGSRSHKKLVLESDIYNDIAYGFKLVQNKVHKAVSVSATPISGGSTTWKDGTERLDIGSTESFGVYNENGVENFVYSLSGNRQTILEADIVNVDVNLGPDDLTEKGEEMFEGEVEILLSGTKGGLAFSRTMKVKGRRL